MLLIGKGLKPQQQTSPKDDVVFRSKVEQEGIDPTCPLSFKSDLGYDKRPKETHIVAHTV